MVSIRVIAVTGEHYHVYNRGVEKRVIFNDEHDYQRFLLLLLLSNDVTSVDVGQSIHDYSILELIQKTRQPLVSIHAFSLLSNHYHLLLSPKVDCGVSKFMQKVATGYTMYFNNMNERSGGLFQGKYKIKHAEEEGYLKYLFEYIHLNPIREAFNTAGSDQVSSLVEKAEKHPWTSLSVYSGGEMGRLSDSVLDQTLFYELNSSYDTHRKNICDWKEESSKTDGLLEEGRTFLKDWIS